MLIFVVIQVIILIFGCFAKDLPPNIPKCQADDPKMGECIAKAANALRSYIRKGITELGMPSFAPFILSSFHVSQSSNLVNYSVEAWNFTLYGLDNYDLTEITYNPENMTFKATLQFDSLLLESVYTITGSLVHVPIEGKGISKVTFGPVNTAFEINGNMIKHKNIDHYNPKNLHIKLNIEDVSVQFDGLFDNNPTLADFTNNMLNQNSKLLVQGVTPALETIAEKFIMRYFKWLTKTFSYYQLFPRSQLP